VGGNLGHRVKVHGLVTLYRPGKAIFLQSDDGSVFAQTQQNTLEITVGDEVDLVGFATMGPNQNYRIPSFVERALELCLSDAQFQRDIMFQSYDGDLIVVTGKLTGHSLNPGQQILHLQDGDTVFEAELFSPQVPQEFESLRDGTLLQVTGICTIEVDEDQQPVRFRMRLRSTQDVTVILMPSWWTLSRTFAVIGSMILAIFIVLAWAATLRRRVHEATKACKAQRRLPKPRTKRKALSWRP